MFYDALAIFSGRGSIRGGTRRGNPRNSFDQRRTTDTTHSFRRDDGPTGVPRKERFGQRVMRYLKTHQPLLVYVAFVGFVEALVLLGGNPF